MNFIQINGELINMRNIISVKPEFFQKTKTGKITIRTIDNDTIVEDFDEKRLPEFHGICLLIEKS